MNFRRSIFTTIYKIVDHIIFHDLTALKWNLIYPIYSEFSKIGSDYKIVNYRICHEQLHSDFKFPKKIFSKWFSFHQDSNPCRLTGVRYQWYTFFQRLDHLATEEIKISFQVGNEFYQSLYVRAHDWSLSFHNFLWNINKLSVRSLKNFYNSQFIVESISG